MKYYTLIARLWGAPAAAVAVEWTAEAAPLDSGRGWEPCLKLGDAVWRFSSWDIAGATQPHLRDPGNFAQIAIRYRQSPTGAWSAASVSRKDFVILATTEQPCRIAPVPVLAPTLIGAGKIGTVVTAEPGLWCGEPALWHDFQWRRNGAPILGADTRSYSPGPGDNLVDLDCLVTAGNAAGEVSAITAALRVTYRAPTIAAELPEEVFDEDTGPQVVQTAFAFAGENLTFSAAGGGAIQPRSGALTLATDTPVSGRVVTITATNSGGQVSAALRYTVEAVAAPRLEADDVTVLRSEWRPAGQTVTFSPVLAFPGLTAAARAVAEIQFLASPLTDDGDLWHPVAPLPGEAGSYWLPDSYDPAYPTFNVALWRDDARRFGRLRFRYRLAADQSWSEESVTRDVPLPAATGQASYVVGSVTQLLDAMTRATSGQIIDIAPGNYGTVTISSALTKTPENVILRPRDRNNPPVFQRGFEFSANNPSRGFTFDGLRFVSNQVDAQSNGSWPAGRAFNMQRSRNFVIRNCLFDGYHETIRADKSQDLLIEWCEFRNIGMDSIRLFTDSLRITIRHNNFHSPKADPARWANSDRHCDYIQLATSETTLPAKDILIENNRFVTMNGYHQVIFTLNARVSRNPPLDDPDLYSHERITIRNNYIESAHPGAIALGGIKGFLVENNLIRQFSPNGWDGVNNVPRIIVSGPNSGIVRNNVWPAGLASTEGFLLNRSAGNGPIGTLTNIARSGNRLSATATPTGWVMPDVGPYGYR